MISRTSTSRPSLRRFWGALAALTVAAVAIATGPARALATPPEQAERRFEVMTYNGYLGANLQLLFGITDPIELIDAAAAVFAHVDQVDFNVRAVAIARQIVEASPDVVGLQELSLWQTAPLSNPAQLKTRYDFLQILLDELERQGHPYRAVSVNENFSGALPISATTLARLTMRDVILARSDLSTSELKVSHPTSHNFQAKLPLAIGGNPIQVLRGWSSVDVKVRGKSYRFVNTHLEAFSAVIRNLQAQELAAWMSESPLPVVLVGDLNSLPTDLAGAYGIMLGAGFVDTWVEAMDGLPGFTAGQDADLMNLPSELDHTVDYVMHNEDGFVDAVPGSGDIIGEEVADRTPSGLWPSDHAGMSITLHIAQP